MLNVSDIFSLRVVDIIDIILFAVILFEVYNLVKGTAAIRIFIGILAVYLVYKIVNALHMQLLGEILGQFISVGVIALIVVFQPEIRQLLLMVGNTQVIRKGTRRFLFWQIKVMNPAYLYIEQIVKACKKMADTKTGALIVISRQNELKAYIETGQAVDAKVSEVLLETLFFKNSPLHDGAVIIVGDTIRAARCIMPVSAQTGLPARLGLRHRAALGITERSDAIAIIVSEERGEISYSCESELKIKATPSELNAFLEKMLKE